MHISGSIDPITLIWVSLERSFHLAELELKWCQFWSKVMTSEVEQRLTLFTDGYSRHRSQWVNKKIRNSIPFIPRSPIVYLNPDSYTHSRLLEKHTLDRSTYLSPFMPFPFQDSASRVFFGVLPFIGIKCHLTLNTLNASFSKGYVLCITI